VAAAQSPAQGAATKPDEDEEQHAEIEKLERQGLAIHAGMLAVFPVAGGVFGSVARRGFARYRRDTCLRGFVVE
jgi:hypothetical protein